MSTVDQVGQDRKNNFKRKKQKARYFDVIKYFAQ